MNSIVSPATVEPPTDNANRLVTALCVDEAVNVNVACCQVELVVNGTVVLVNTVPLVERKSAVKLPETLVEGGVRVR